MRETEHNDMGLEKSYADSLVSLIHSFLTRPMEPKLEETSRLLCNVSHYMHLLDDFDYSN